MAKKPKELFKRWHKRRWLNTTSDGGVGFIKMEVYSVDDERTWEEASGEIVIADCSRMITLDFHPGNEVADIKNAMGKIDILMLSLGEFRGKLQEAMDAAKISRANGKKLDKKEKK